MNFIQGEIKWVILLEKGGVLISIKRGPGALEKVGLG